MFQKVLEETGLLDGFTDVAHPFDQNHLTEAVDRLFVAFDVSKNGKIDIQEYLNGITFLSSDHFEDRLRFLFLAYDAERKGFLTADQISTLLHISSRLLIRNSKDLTAITAHIDQTFLPNIQYLQVDSNGRGILTENQFLFSVVSDQVISSLLSSQSFTPPETDLPSPRSPAALFASPPSSPLS